MSAVSQGSVFGFEVIQVASVKRKEILVISGDDPGVGRVTNRSDDRIKT